jgi:hypothetical protein
MHSQRKKKFRRTQGYVNVQTRFLNLEEEEEWKKKKKKKKKKKSIRQGSLSGGKRPTSEPLLAAFLCFILFSKIWVNSSLACEYLLPLVHFLSDEVHKLTILLFTNIESLPPFTSTC